MADGSDRRTADGGHRDERPAGRPAEHPGHDGGDPAERLYRWLDARLGLDSATSLLGKAFPAEDSFLLGEVALFCFLVLVLTGVFLGFFFEPSTSEVTYQGSVDRYQGDDLPEAFVSVLNITYDVPYGMFLRRMHHWAAHLFVAAIALHMLRVFFTGAYRNPREPNWVVGSGLAVLAMFAAYTGYALPFDEFASTATGIGYNIARSVPLAGDPLSRLVFGGEFPSSATVPRLYFIHVFVVPAAIAALLGVHMAILVRQKHTEAPREGDVPGRAAGDRAARTDGSTADAGPDAGGDGHAATAGGASHAVDGGAAAGGRVARDDDSVVVGLPAFPNQAAVSAVVFFLTFATLSLLSGFLPVHNVAEYGPNDPASTPGLVMPDWFLMWLYGFLKLLPSWASFTVAGVHVSTEFLGGVVLPSVVFAVLVAWPFVDYHPEPVHFTADPIARPAQTAVGVAGVVLVMLASLAGMNNLVADMTGTSTDIVNPVLTVLVVLGPVTAGLVVYSALGGSLEDLRERLPERPGGDGGDEQ